jgi:mannose-6-phosphate isomerase-like protein (cupin superfamily)
MQPLNMTQTYLQLSANGQFDKLYKADTFWQALTAGQFPELEQGLLCSAISFDCSWAMWERHPAGAELVLLLAGTACMIFEQDGAEYRQLLLQPGDFVLVPTGAWHTVDMTKSNTSSCTLLFFTPGAGTEHKPR